LPFHRGLGLANTLARWRLYSSSHLSGEVVFASRTASSAHASIWKPSSHGGLHRCHESLGSTSRLSGRARPPDAVPPI